MASNLFFVRLIGSRPNFAATMSPQEQATMRAHGEFLNAQMAAGKLVVAGPVFDPQGSFGMAVFEAESMDEVHRILEGDPAKAVGRHEVAPMGPSLARPAR